MDTAFRKRIPFVWCLTIICSFLVLAPNLSAADGTVTVNSLEELAPHLKKDGVHTDHGRDNHVQKRAVTDAKESMDTDRVLAESLEAGFTNPPAQARPLVWWHWINGNVTKEGIRADLEDMKRVGIAGVQMFDVHAYLPPGPVRYGSDLWHEHLQYAIRTAAELELEFDLMNCPGWSASGGPWITPERSMKEFTWSETVVEGGERVTVVLPRPPNKLGFYRDVAVLAVPWSTNAYPGPAERHKAFEFDSLTPDERNLQLANMPWRIRRLPSVTPYALVRDAAPIGSNQVLQVTGLMDGAGRFDGGLPAGRWTLLRFGFTTTGSKNHPAAPEGMGLECDKLDADSVAFQFEQALGQIIRESGTHAGKDLRGIVFDSFEAGFQNWTDVLPQEFRRLKGYDLLPFIPVLTGRVIGSAEESEAVRRDFQSVVNELVATRYFGTMQSLAHQHGLQVYAEAQGGLLNRYLCNRYTDVPMYEFWMPDVRDRIHNLKQTASIANVSGRPITAAEAFSAGPDHGRWLATPATLKTPGDGAFAGGINRLILHSYVHQPYSDIAPGFTLGRYGTHFGRLNAWWPFADAWVDYLARSQFLLQQGRTVADIGLLANEHVGYALSAQAVEVPRGFNFDVIYPHDLARMTWSDGGYRLPQGLVYPVLVVPEKWVADLATLRQLESFVSAGATLVGPPPSAPSGWRELREHKREWDDLVAKIWGTTGRVRSRAALQQTLDELGVAPDCELSTEPAGATVWFIHRTTPEADIYFLSNQSGAPVRLDARFRSGPRVPELWNAVTGRIADAPGFELSEGRARVPLTLDEGGSIFVVFRRQMTSAQVAPAVGPAAVETAASDTVSISGPWQVRFQPGRQAPQEIRMESLASWTEHHEPGVRYFSGTATYRTSFNVAGGTMQRDRVAVLRLGRVCDIAEVTINGRRVGVAWTPPYELEVTPWLRSGTNVLEIAVANRWVNRIIGDTQLPPDARYEPTGGKYSSNRLAELPSWLGRPEATRQRERLTFATWRFYEQDSPLIESGLLGPVQLEFRPAIKLADTEHGSTRQPSSN